MRANRWRAAVLASLLLCALNAPPARAGVASEAGWQLGSAASTLLYAPLKMVFATTGLVFGGIGWGLSGGSSEVLDTIVTPAVRGDYLVTPAHLRGDRSLAFVGPLPGEGGPDQAVVDRDDSGDGYEDAYYDY